MSRIANLEREILDQLINALMLPDKPHPKVDVQAWPDNPTTFRMVHPMGTVLLIYKGTTYAKSSADRDIAEYEITIMSRTLRDPNPTDGVTTPLGVGMYELLDTLVKAIHGWRPEYAVDQLRVNSDGFQGYTEGVWSYSLRTSVPLFASIALAPSTGPWTDQDCRTAPPLKQTDYVYQSQTSTNQGVSNDD